MTLFGFIYIAFLPLCSFGLILYCNQHKYLMYVIEHFFSLLGNQFIVHIINAIYIFHESYKKEKKNYLSKPNMFV